MDPEAKYRELRRAYRNAVCAQNMVSVKIRKCAKHTVLTEAVACPLYQLSVRVYSPSARQRTCRRASGIAEDVAVSDIVRRAA